MRNEEHKNEAMPVDLDALEALLEKATPGEWTASSQDWFALRTHALIICDRPPVFYAESHAAWPDNSGAIAALHNAAPALIAELRELREDEALHVSVIGDLMAETTTLKAEIEKLQAANRWRPIAEAPKDNAVIEAIDSRTGFVRVVDYYAGYAPTYPHWNPCWALQGASNRCYPLDYFTHFRPIPDPPEA
jgi:hypothetical protein